MRCVTVGAARDRSWRHGGSPTALAEAHHGLPALGPEQGVAARLLAVTPYVTPYVATEIGSRYRDFPLVDTPSFLRRMLAGCPTSPGGEAMPGVIHAVSETLRPCLRLSSSSCSWPNA